MFHSKLMEKQIHLSGVRLGDSCSIYPFYGRKKAFTLNRHCIDLISARYRPENLSLSYVELPNTHVDPFHYRLELDEQPAKEGRFVLRTLKGRPFWLNGLAAREAYVERLDRIYIDDNKLNFDHRDLQGIVNDHFDHPVLSERLLLESSLNVLIQGETGTGKSHLARKIHERSGRSGPFVAVNLSSFNPQLIESELFGHKKGAFTGAFQDKQGAFVTAENGTLFIDEVDSLPLELQTKLLTFLDNKTFRRVGEAKETEIKTRLIFASGKPLEVLVKKGLFRNDFYFRLKSSHVVNLVSLRNDISKIREACQHFALRSNVSLSLRLVEFYETLAWPGNLRQLFGHLEKKKVLSKSSKLDFDHLDEELLLQSSDLSTIDPGEEIVPMDQVKSDYVKKALGLCDGNLALTARRLLLSEKTVRSILSKSVGENVSDFNV